MLPAHAGMIPTPLMSRLRVVCAPRACGDDPLEAAVTDGLMQVLPAHAGMIPDDEGNVVSITSAPRACGDDPYAREVTLLDGECSPRMRG